MNLRDLPIRRKLMLIMLVTTIVVMLLMRATFFTYEYLTFRQAMVRQVTMLGGILSANSAAALAFENSDDAREILSALAAEPHILAAALYDRNGRFFAGYPTGLPADAFPAAPGPDGHQFTDSALQGSYPILQKDLRLGTLFLRFDTGTMLHEFLWGSLRIALVVMAVVLFAAYFLARSLQRQISAPVLELADAARAISERADYAVRVRKQGNDELGLLTDAFNRMLDRIQQLNQELERRVIERTAQLEAANKELEAFSYSVSHDLRAPLRHIDGFAGLLLKSDGKALSERGRSHLATITSSAKQMGILIDDLLVFSQMGRSEMRHGLVDLQQLAQETIQDLKAQNPARNIIWQLSPLPTVRGDRPMLRQVFVNLLANAVKYSGPRDPAIIAIAAVTDPASGELIVSVRDNGVGFDMAYAHKLFGVFQRLHRAEEFEGTGIGLANIRRIIGRHGGRTWAEGKPDEGATFYFSLPQSSTS